MKTEIAFILDRSGSMGSMTHAAISGFNEVLAEEHDIKSGSDAISKKVSASRRADFQCALGPAETATLNEPMSASLEKSRREKK